jgi:ribosomal protein L6P/L9E
MSRIGKKPVQVPAGITATVDGQKVTAKGPKGELFFVANDEISLKLENNAVVVTPVNQTKDARAKWGMSRTMIEGIFKGVKDGFERKLEINGVGYRAAMQGKDLKLSLGFSHTIVSAATRMPDHGVWARGRDRLYVHRGNGHYGFPLRVGVPAEESVLEVFVAAPAP